jgi:DNA-directed RNA polymerase omega subunit
LVDELTNVTGGAYSAVNIAAKRARQLTAYRAGLGEGLLVFVGPVVTPRHRDELPLTTALRELHAGLLEVTSPNSPYPA